MTARKRLIELIGSKVCEAYDSNCDEWQPHSCEKCYANDCMIGELADYLLAEGFVMVDTKVVSPKNRPLISQCLGRPLDEIIELVHEKDEGRIVVLPCKVGDTVYRIVKLLNGEAKIVEGEVFEIAITHEHHDGNECQFYFLAKGEEFTRKNYSIWCDFVDFGKTVFLSREEAEKALAERRGK
jgi:hypothetical protein